MTYEVRGLRQDEFEQHAELVYTSYAHGRRFDPDAPMDQMLSRPDWWLQGIRAAPDYRPEQTRVMVADGKLVSSVTCYPRPSYVAGRIAKASCLGSVCTHPEYRRRGLLRRLLEEAVTWMSAQGILWSFLYGLEDVYGGSGWQHLASRSVKARLRPREDAGDGVVERPVTCAADIEELIHLHSDFSSRHTGPTQRSRAYWLKDILGRDSSRSGFSLLDKAGQTVGYYRGHDGYVEELAWRSAPDDVLGFLLQRWPSSTLELPICTEEALSSLRDLGAIPTQKDCQEDGGSTVLLETSRGLWRYHADPEGLFPECGDTEALLRFLRTNDYVMWPADRA